MASLFSLPAYSDLAWIDGYGFVPVVYVNRRQDKVDPPWAVPAPDADMPYAGKFDWDGPVLSGYVWGTVLEPLPVAATPMAQALLLAVPGGEGASSVVPGNGWTPLPGFPGIIWRPEQPTTGTERPTTGTERPGDELPVPSPIPVEIGVLGIPAALLLAAVLVWWSGYHDTNRAASGVAT